MKERSRRQFLAAVGASGSYVSFSLGTRAAAEIPTPADTPTSSEPVDVRGAIYLPARAFNTYQQWSGYDREVVERDLGYAASVNLNAVRTWLCYEHWLEAPEAHGRALEHFLRTADDSGIRVLLGIFEGVGEAPTRGNLLNDDPADAVGVYSPSWDIVRDPDQWGRPREFVRWVMDRYRDDDRLLAIEIMNEPGWTIQQQFAEGMYETLREERGDVPLTVGSTSLANNAEFMGWDLDAIQFHYNYPSTTAIVEDVLDQATTLQASTSKPVWFAEWQRIRSGRGFRSPVEGDEWQPDYSSMAPLIHRAGVGNFFWTLMVQPAYTIAQREQGVLVGLFHEDGAVWDLDDARTIKAMAGDPSVDHLDERKEWPEWAAGANRR